MKAIILAAGVGSRMGNLTKDIPKCMVSFLGKPILQYITNFLNKEEKITEIVVLRGYKYNQVNLKGLEYKNILNSKNMVDTLFKADSELNGEILIVYGDVIMDRQTIKTLTNSPKDISVLIDKNWYRYYNTRFKDAYEDAESCIVNDRGLILNIGDKNPSKEDLMGQYVGGIKLSQKGCDIFKTFYTNLKKEYQGRKWIRDRFFEEMYMTDFLQGLINSGFEVNAVECNNGWLEFDSESDIECYEHLYEENKLNEFINL